MKNCRTEIQLVKLTDGGRLLRLSEKASGLCLEKRLVAQQPVVRQKARLLRGFQELLSREAMATAT
jgi:hypothetical protein